MVIVFIFSVLFPTVAALPAFFRFGPALTTDFETSVSVSLPGSTFFGGDILPTFDNFGESIRTDSISFLRAAIASMSASDGSESSSSCRAFLGAFDVTFLSVSETFLKIVGLKIDEK